MKRMAMALTWDGARWPIRSLPPKARAFLGSTVAPSAQKVAAIFQDDQVKELRICWVPRLQGGDDVLSAPFSAGTRIAFRSVKTTVFGEVLGIVYRRIVEVG